jgi:hypothetical protein
MALKPFIVGYICEFDLIGSFPKQPPPIACSGSITITGGVIKLIHGDPHRGNIIVTSTRPPRILAVVDWAHFGQYPDYWEYCKAAYTSSYNGE